MRIGIDLRKFDDRIVDSINKKLKTLPHKDNPVREYRVNSSETTSALLDTFFTLPPSDVYWGIEESDLENFTDIIMKYFPSGVIGTNFLPRTFVDIHSAGIIFAKELNGTHSRFVYSLKIFTNYFGGAKTDDIIQPAKGNYKASVKTPRIYYESYIFPINTISAERHPFHYTTIPVLELTDNIVPVVLTADRKYSWNVVFDDPDFSEQNLKMSRLITGGDWKRKELYPVEIKGDTIGLHIPYPDVELAEQLLPGFDAMIGQIKKNIVSEESYKPIREFYNGLEFKAVFSASKRREFLIREKQ